MHRLFLIFGQFRKHLYQEPDLLCPELRRKYALILHQNVRRDWIECYLQHVVDDVEFDDRLPSDQVVHHGVIEVMRHGERQQQDQGLQYVTHVCWLQQPRPTEHKHTHKTWTDERKCVTQI